MDGISISLEMHAFSIADTEPVMISAKERKVESESGGILLVSSLVVCANIHCVSLIRFQSARTFPQGYK